MGYAAPQESFGLPVQDKILGKRAELIETGFDYNLYQISFDNGHKISIEERNYQFEGICYFINAVTDGIRVRVFINPNEIDGKRLTRDIFEYADQAPKVMPEWARELEGGDVEYAPFPWPRNRRNYEFR